MSYIMRTMMMVFSFMAICGDAEHHSSVWL